jgi:hypothetical protein
MSVLSLLPALVLSCMCINPAGSATCPSRVPMCSARGLSAYETRRRIDTLDSPGSKAGQASLEMAFIRPLAFTLQYKQVHKQSSRASHVVTCVHMFGWIVHASLYAVIAGFGFCWFWSASGVMRQTHAGHLGDDDGSLEAMASRPHVTNVCHTLPSGARDTPRRRAIMQRSREVQTRGLL